MHASAAVSDRAPVPLLCPWARRGLEASLAWDAPPLVTDRLWARVTGVQVAVASSGEQQWATFTALFDDFAGTLGELAATVAAVLA